MGMKHLQSIPSKDRLPSGNIRIIDGVLLNVNRLLFNVSHEEVEKRFGVSHSSSHTNVSWFVEFVT